MATVLPAEQSWSRAFPASKRRPKLYTSNANDEDGFRPINDPAVFLEDISQLKPDQLYAVASNNALALKNAQAEYLEITRELNAIKGIDREVKDVQAPEHDPTFEERKEASLYGQTYDSGKPQRLYNSHPTEVDVAKGRSKGDEKYSEQERQDVRYAFDPFQIFYPKPKGNPIKAKQKTLEAGRDAKNIDNFPTYNINGKEYFPVQAAEQTEYTFTYTKRELDENGVPRRPVSPDPGDPQASQQSQNGQSTQSTQNSFDAAFPRKRNTRYNGLKVPNTREVSEAPSGVSTPKRKRPDTPMDPDTREGTPNKRSRTIASVFNHMPPTVSNMTAMPPNPLTYPPNPPQVQIPTKKPHPNQYTKKREQREREAAAAAAAGGYVVQPSAPTPDWSSLTDDEKWNRKWTDAELLDAIRADHTWLGPNADDWRNRLVNTKNPVRSWAMLKKWGEWKTSGQDKRPRNKEKSENEGGSKEGSRSRKTTPNAKVEEGSGAVPVLSNGVHHDCEENGVGHAEAEKENEQMEEQMEDPRGGRPTLSRRSTRRSGF